LLQARPRHYELRVGTADARSLDLGPEGLVVQELSAGVEEVGLVLQEELDYLVSGLARLLTQLVHFLDGLRWEDSTEALYEVDLVDALSNHIALVLGDTGFIYRQALVGLDERLVLELGLQVVVNAAVLIRYCLYLVLSKRRCLVGFDDHLFIAEDDPVHCPVGVPLSLAAAGCILDLVFSEAEVSLLEAFLRIHHFSLLFWGEQVLVFHPLLKLGLRHMNSTC